MDSGTWQMVGTAAAAIIATLGGKEMITFVLRRLVVQREARLQAESGRATAAVQHELGTSAALIEQLRKQNELTAQWLMNTASGDLRQTVDRLGDVQQRLGELFSAFDMITRQLTGITDELLEMKGFLYGQRYGDGTRADDQRPPV